MENKSNVPKPQRSREGSLNPMWNKRQSPETKQKISDSQKERYARIRQRLQAEGIELKGITGKADQEAKLDLLKQCIFTDSINFKDVQQALNYIAIMSAGINSNYLKSVINNELNKRLTDLNSHV